LLCNISSDLLDEYYGDTLGRRLSLLQKKGIKQTDAHVHTKEFFEEHHWHNSSRIVDELGEKHFLNQNNSLLGQVVENQEAAVTIQDKLNTTIANAKRKQMITSYMEDLKMNFEALKRSVREESPSTIILQIDAFLKLAEGYLPRLIYSDIIIPRSTHFKDAKNMINNACFNKLITFATLCKNPELEAQSLTTFDTSHIL
jgi:hypothetical protein